MDLSPFLEGFSWLRQALVHGGGPQVIVVLVGAGRKDDVRLIWEMVQALGLQDVVRVMPNVAEELKATLYASADVFCSLVDNYQETFGLTVMKAMVAGLPVVASDFSGYRDLVSHGQTGFLIPTCASNVQEPWDAVAGLLDPSVLRFFRAQKVAVDMSAMIHALHTLICQMDVRRKFSQQAKRRAQAFHWAKVIGAYGELWKELVSMARRDVGKDYVRDYRPLITPSVSKLFSHYPTRVLADDSVLVMGPMGSAFLAQEYRPVSDAEMKMLVKEKCLWAMTRHVSRREVSVKELTLWVSKIFGMDRHVVMLHLDWLMKHGILEHKKC
ncbi:glycosyltransferase [Desulfosoma caldarium]|uniref:glycosyltransferase n=1 Tax=Desulfosoma caldarium TaxID=610254 RepID=UPI000F4A7D92|nr:glycosyltransferase [Desulfosoma caldarium]